MISREALFKQVEVFSAELDKGLEAGHFIQIKDDYSLSVRYRSMPKIEAIDLKLPLRWGVVVALDIREWTKRTLAGQLAVGAVMNNRAMQSLKMLQDHGLLSAEEPLFMAPTGDGSYIVFDAGEDVDVDEKKSSAPPSSDKLAATRLEAIKKGLLFVLTLNTLFAEQNARRPSSACFGKNNEEIPFLPIYPRFAITLDRMILCLDMKGSLNAIGNAMYNCGRILSSDHGNHFLVNGKLLHECDRYGGLGQVASHAGPGDWQARFHIAELPETKIKSGMFRYAACTACAR